MEEEVIESHKYDKFRYLESFLANEKINGHDFLNVVKPQGLNNLPYAFIETPVSFLNEEIPEGANWSTKENGQKTLDEYTINKVISKDATKVVFALCAMEEPTYRTPALTFDDLQDWETWLNTKGYSIDNFLTITDRETLLASKAYRLGDE